MIAPVFYFSVKPKLSLLKTAKAGYPLLQINYYSALRSSRDESGGGYTET